MGKEFLFGMRKKFWKQMVVMIDLEGVSARGGVNTILEERKQKAEGGWAAEGRSPEHSRGTCR